jgi:uncharacterized membrane protein
MYLAHQEAEAIAAQIAGIERRTGVEIVVAIVGRADPYPEARWKAFALAVAFAALLVVAIDLTHVDWPVATILLPAVVAILAIGIVNALAAQFVPPYARLYVRHNRAEAEVRQYAESLFLSRSMFTARERRAVLLVVALFERRVVAHPDAGLTNRVAGDEWQRIVDPVASGVRAGERAEGIQAGLSALEKLLDEKGFVGTGSVRNALGNRPLEERGS